MKNPFKGRLITAISLLFVCFVGLVFALSAKSPILCAFLGGLIGVFAMDAAQAFESYRIVEKFRGNIEAAVAAAVAAKSQDGGNGDGRNS